MFSIKFNKILYAVYQVRPSCIRDVHCLRPHRLYVDQQPFKATMGKLLDATPKKRPSFGRAAADRKLPGAAGRTPSAAIASAPASRSSTPASERPSVGWRGVKADFGSRSPSSPQSLPRPTSAPPSSARKVDPSTGRLARPVATEPALPKSKGVRDVTRILRSLSMTQPRNASCGDKYS